MQTFYLTDAGKVRGHNEDNVTIINNNHNEYLLAVADGMGGHKAGEVASEIAINCLSEGFYRLDTLGDKDTAIDWLRDIVTEINILYGNIGDSSGYAYKNNKLYKVTKDHTLVNLLVATGELTAEEAKYHPRKNVLMRALGANDPIEIDIFDVDTSVKGLFLCSDGLTNMLTEEQIEKILNSDLSIEDTIVKLIRKANSRGGTDNITIAYLKKESGDL